MSTTENDVIEIHTRGELNTCDKSYALNTLIDKA